MSAVHPSDLGSPYDGEGWRTHFGDQEISQFRGAELIAENWRVPREAMAGYALTSHERAIAAQRNGLFDEEIVPSFGLTADEGPRSGTTREKIAGLKPLSPGGRLTSAVSSQISDGAAALLVASADAVRRHGLRPLARVPTMAVVGSDPVMMFTGPIPATGKVLQRAGRVRWRDRAGPSARRARMMTTLVHQLRRTGGRYGLQPMCEGRGMANATLVDRR